MSHIIYDIYFEKRENITYESNYGTQLIQNLVKLRIFHIFKCINILNNNSISNFI